MQQFRACAQNVVQRSIDASKVVDPDGRINDDH
jgi:hypothetical protein